MARGRRLRLTSACTASSSARSRPARARRSTRSSAAAPRRRGGGDSACQEALTLAGSLSKVLILCRGEELRAQATYRARVAEEPTIEVRHGVVVEEILGDSKVGGVRTAAGEEIDLDAVFVYVGLAPNSEPVAGLLSLDEGGRVPTDRSLLTELPGLFAAGIVRTGAAGQAAASAGDGAAAAKAAARHLANGGASHA